MTKSQKRVEFKTTLTKSPADSGWHFLVVKKEIVAKFGFEGKFKRVVCSINGTEGFQCALLPSGDLFYIIVNKKKRDSIGIVAGDTVKVVLVKDESKYGLPMPEEFAEVFESGCGWRPHVSRTFGRKATQFDLPGQQCFGHR